MPIRPVVRVAAVLAAGLFALVAVFQLVVVAGAPWGALTQGGGVDGALPPGGRALAAGSAVVVAVLGLAVLARVGLGPLRRRRWTDVVAWIAVAYTLVAVVLNAATPSGAERALWLPVSLVLAVTTLTAVLGSRRRR